MPNTVDANGLTTKTDAELASELTSDFQTIYGTDINLNQNSPDGQFLGIVKQAILDLLSLVTQVFSSFDPDQAIGVVLDQRVAINNIRRQGGTRTLITLDVTSDRTLNLIGYNSDPNNAYTVSDDQGNQFQLIDSYSFVAPGTQNLQFQAVTIGLVEPIPNTITTPVTIVLGITTINNPGGADVIGENQETDAELKDRRLKSVSINAQGYLASLLAALENITGVVNAIVYENITSVTDSDGIPGHSIWCIVEGGDPGAIAEAIYEKRNAGCGMKGLQEVTIIQVDNTPFVIAFDRVVSQDVYIQFTIHALDGVIIDPDFIKTQLVANLHVNIYESLDVSKINSAVAAIEPSSYLTDIHLSKNNINWYDIVTPDVKNKRFLLTTANIDVTVL